MRNPGVEGVIQVTKVIKREGAGIVIIIVIVIVIVIVITKGVVEGTRRHGEDIAMREPREDIVKRIMAP